MDVGRWMFVTGVIAVVLASVFAPGTRFNHWSAVSLDSDWAYIRED